MTVTLTVLEIDKLGETSSTVSGGAQTHRALVDATEYERWERAQRGMPIQRFTFAIPPDGPFSYEGEHLSLTWRASAREPVRFRPDPASSLGFRVLP